MTDGSSPEGIKVLVNPPTEKIDKLAHFMRWSRGSFYENTPQGHLIVVDTKDLQANMVGLGNSCNPILYQRELSITSEKPAKVEKIEQYMGDLGARAKKLGTLSEDEFARVSRMSLLAHELDHKNQNIELDRNELQPDDVYDLNVILQRGDLDEHKEFYRALNNYEVFSEVRAIIKEMRAQRGEPYQVMNVFRLGSVMELFRMLPQQNNKPRTTAFENLLAFETGDETASNNSHLNDTAVIMLLTGRTDLLNQSPQAVLTMAPELGRQVLERIGLFLLNPEVFIATIANEKILGEVNEGLKKAKANFASEAHKLMKVPES